MSQIGVAGNAMVSGIPTITVTVTGRSGQSRAFEIFSQVRKTPMADKNETVGNDGEFIRSRARNKRMQVAFSAKPRGATTAAAQVICADLPDVDSLVTVTCADDGQVATPVGGSTVCDTAELTYTPEGDAVVEFTFTHWFNKVLTNLT